MAASSDKGTPGPEEALAKLADVRASVTRHFGSHHEARLGQFTSAVDTAVMALEHLVDEEAREVDLAKRIRDRATVHGDHEVASPVNRSFTDTRRIAEGG